MTDSKPTTVWAFISLACSILGCLAFLALIAMAEQYGEIANASAGVGIIWGMLHGLVAAILCMWGVIFAFVALLIIHISGYRGKGLAWAAMALGVAPFAIFAILFFMSNADSNPLRR